MTTETLSVLAPCAGRAFGERVCEALGLELAPVEERDFEDGEHKIRPLSSVRGHDVYVVQSLCSDSDQSVNDKLCRLAFLVGALRDAAAARVTVVAPYLAYARKDRKTKARDPVTTRYVAAMLEAVGTERVLTLDVHNLAAYQNAFRCRSEHLSGAKLFAGHFAGMLRGAEKVAVVSPDAGGVKRADAFRQVLAAGLKREVPLAFMEKARSQGVVRSGEIVGDVAGATVIILDDLISTGGTLARAAAACKARGAETVYAAATHGVLVTGADEALADDALDGVVLTDTIPIQRSGLARAGDKLEILPVAAYIAEAIRRVHTGGSLVELQGG